jgi:hypothetical protein
MNSPVEQSDLRSGCLRQSLAERRTGSIWFVAPHDPVFEPTQHVNALILRKAIPDDAFDRDAYLKRISSIAPR